MSKLIKLKDVASLVRDHDMVGIGGNVLHRSPNALLTELVKDQKKGLRLVKTAGAYDVDLLVRAGCVASVDAGFISYETEFGLAKYYRKAVETGQVKANEHACYTVMCALNAAKINSPFMPVYGLQISDLIEANDYFKSVVDPFTGQEIHVVKALKPDVALIHVHACDEMGNAYIEGPRYDDVLMAKASDLVILSTERILPTAQLKMKFERLALSGVLVDYVVHVPKGAYPCSCSKLYDVDKKRINEFLTLEDDAAFEKYIKEVSLRYEGGRR